MENKKKLIELLKNKEKLEDFHLCELCKDILEEPVACKNCEGNFCTKCIRNFANQNNSQCFNKCKFEESKPSKLVYKALDVLQFTCTNNQCKEISTYNNYFNHLKECMYIVITCEFCQKQLIKQDYEEHISKCEEFELRCEICDLKQKRRDFLKHDTINCLKEFAIVTKKEKIALENQMKKLVLEFNNLQDEMIRKQDLNKILEKEILKKDEQNQEIRSRLEYLEKQFSDLLKVNIKDEKKIDSEISIKNLIKEKIIVGWDPLLSKQGRCVIDVNDNKKLKIESESCWNHFVVNKMFINENFIIEVEAKISQEQNYVYFGMINENYSNINNCMCQTPKNAFYIRCNGDIAIDATRFERKDMAWYSDTVVITMKVLLKERLIYFSILHKEQAGPFNLTGNTFRVVAGTCNKAKGEVNLLSCFQL